MLWQKPFVFTPTDCGGFVRSAPDVEVPDLQLQFASIQGETGRKLLANNGLEVDGLQTLLLVAAGCGEGSIHGQCSEAYLQGQEMYSRTLQ